MVRPNAFCGEMVSVTPIIQFLLFLQLSALPLMAQDSAYLANLGSNSVSVLSTLDNSVAAVIPVGNNPFAIAAAPDGSRVYTADANSSRLSVISVATNTVVDTIPLSFNPIGLAIAGDGTRAYVMNAVTIGVVDLLHKTTIGTIIPGGAPFDIAASADGSRVYVVNSGDNTVSVINTATNVVIATVPVGRSPVALTVSADGTRVWVANNGDSNLTVIDATNNTVVGSVPLGVPASGVAINPSGTRAYAAVGFGVYVIDTASLTIVAKLLNLNGVTKVTVGLDGAHLYAVNWFPVNTVSVLDTVTNSLIATIPVGSFPRNLVIPPPPQPKPAVSLSTSALSFAVQPTGSTSAAQSVVLSNVGTAALTIGGITAAGPFAQTNACGASLAPGASCTISVTFLPQTVGPQSGAITIMDNATPATQTVTLTGSGKGFFEAESGVNSLSGPARVEPCAGCSGGSMVTHLGSNENGMIAFNGITASAAQTYTLIVAYLNGSNGTRNLSYSVNGGAIIPVSYPGSGSWDGIPATLSFQVLLQAGNNTVSFYNPFSPGPNLDQIAIQ
jgi:YVTN family beta-propeller protein